MVLRLRLLQLKMRTPVMARVLGALLLVVLTLLIFPNARSLYEGIFFYLRDTVAYNPSAVQTINASGRYASVYELVRFRNVERRDYLLRQLNVPNVHVTQIPIANSALVNIFVRFDSPGPYTIYSAHYDKLFDDPLYQGASDNTAAVSVLLASVTELAKRTYRGSAAFLFTGEEETGLRGATAFVEYARANNIPIRENVNFDNIGRGKLAIRPSVVAPGFTFLIPFLGAFTYDGRQTQPSPPYELANPRLMKALTHIQPDLVVYERFTARGDSNVFQANGIDTVAISGDDMHYLELTWHTYSDRVELLDERNLDRAYNLVMQYAPW